MKKLLAGIAMIGAVGGLAAPAGSAGTPSECVGRRETAGDEKVPPPSADVIYVEVTGQQARQLLGRTLRVQIDVDDDEAGAS